MAMKISGKLIAKNSMFNLVGEALPSIVAIVTLPFLIHSLGKERFGLFMLIWTIQGYMQFLSLRLGFALIKFASEAIHKGEEDRLSNLTWTTVSLLGGLGSFGGLTLGVFAFSLFTRVFQIPIQLWAEARIALFLTALSLPFTITSTGFLALLQAGQRFDLVNFIQASTGCLRYLLALILAVMGFHLPVIMLGLLIISALRFMAYLLLCVRLYPPIKAISINFSLARPLLWFGGWLSVSQIVGMAIQYLDRFIIGLLLPISYLTYYAAPAEIINRLRMIPQALNRAIFPAYSAQGGSKYSLQLYARAMKFILIIFAPVAFVLFFFSGDLLTLYLGKEIAIQSAPVLQWLAFGFLISVLGAVTHNFVLALGYPNAVAKFHLVELPLYAGIALWFTSKMGIQGMAIAWLLRRVLEAGYVFLILQRAAPSNISELVSNGMGRAIAVSGVLGIFLFLLSFIPIKGSPLLNILLVSIGLIGYGIITWQQTLNSAERNAFSSLLHRQTKGASDGGSL